MSGINHLYDIYNKKGQEFVDQLFNTFVTVNEKMDGSAFTFERDKETGKFKFYRRDQRNPITFVDRTLMKYYEKPIQYIESLPPNILEKIPRGWRFGLEYFANTKPVEIVYDKIPKNHLILSYVHEYGEDGKIKKTIQDKGELDNWADLLGIDRAPIIFQGHLSEEQKGKITEFLRTPFDQLVQRFKTQSFVRFIIGTLNPELKKSALNEDLDKDVEGIVFRFGDPSKGESEPVLAKMVDPVFTQMSKEKSLKQREEKPSDFLGLTVLDVMNFILEGGLDKFKVDGDTEDERYVSFMGDVFANFLEKYSEKYRGADFNEPEYLKREEFRLNKDLIEDRRVLGYVNEDDSFESLFKLMLNSFRKIKSRSGGIITKGMMEQINLLIRDIKDYIQKERKGSLTEGFLSFLDFKKTTAPEVEYLKEENQETDDDENPFFSFSEFISTLETIDNSSPKSQSKGEDGGKKKDVNLLVGRFQPFHNGHLKMAKHLEEKNGLPSVVVVVYPGHNKSGKSPFTEETIKKYMGGIVEDEKLIEDYIIVQRGLIGSAIVKLLDKGYNPKLIGAGEDRIDDYTKQIEYVKKSDIGDKMSDLELVKTPRTTSATEVRETIKGEDYQKFKRLVPPGVEKMYTTLKSEMSNKTNESEFIESDGLITEGEIFESIENEVFLGDLQKDLEGIQNYLRALGERGSISDEERGKLSGILDSVNRIKNLTKDSSIEEERLKSLIADLVFGELGDKKAKSRKIHKIDSLIHDLTEVTTENLIKRYILEQDIDPISIEDIVNKNNGVLDINLVKGLNGISGKDVKKIYNFDSTVGSGLQQRGKGETLFSLAFNSIKNDFAGGDVKSRDTGKIIEIKSSNNAGITPKSGPPISLEVEEILKTGGKNFNIEELSKGRIQKKSTEMLISKAGEENEKSTEFLNLIRSLSGIKGAEPEDILPILFLFQLNYYSKNLEEFQTFCVFVERADSPDKMIILDSFGETFLTGENIKTLKLSGLTLKVTSSDRAEIYMFNKKK
jgi:hypothetical protein